MTLEAGPLGPALAAADEAGWTTLRLDLDGVGSKAELLRRCGDALRAPEWFGGNWDALADVLRDLSWLPPAPGRLVAITSWHDYARDRPGEWATLREILRQAVDFWRGAGEGDGDDGVVPLAVVLADRPGGEDHAEHARG